MLVADYVEMNKSIIHELFSSQFEIIQTSGSELAFKFLTQYKSSFSIILINESIARGFSNDAIKTLTNLKIFERVPVILIRNSENSRMKSVKIDFPFSDVVASPVNPYVIQKRVANLVELFSHKIELEELVEKQTAKILAQNKALKLQQRKINTINNDMLDTLSTVIEYRDVESGRHIHRIKKFTEVMLRELAVMSPKYNMNEEKIKLIASASSLHDIGKIAIPDSILLSPRRLTYDEFKIMKEHTIKGCDLLNQLDSVERNEYFTYCYDICRYHHEKYDGMGYPDGLKGDKIPIWAQVVSVADCYDALTSDRPYKAAFSHEQAVEMIRTGACGAFSDEMMECFSAVLEDFRKLAAEYADVNNADSSISKGDEKRVSEEEDKPNRDIYRKMDREDLIRTIEKQKQEMLETQRKDNDIINRVSDFVFEFDLKKDIGQERKGKFSTIFGYAPKNYGEAVMLFGDIVAEEYRNKFHRTFRLDSIKEEVKKGNERIILECPMRLGGDIYVAVRCTGVPVVEENELEKVFISIQTLNFSSVTAGLGEIVTDRDPVTGLWNFNGLRNEIEDFITHTGKKGTHMLLLIDIDGFRSINRNTGYRFGNEILKDIGEVLRQQFTDNNIIGRVEDDNFIVFVKDCPDREANVAIVDNIFRKLHKTYTFNGKTYPELSTCIGISDYPKHGKTFEELFEGASKAVDIAKINGKNMYLFYNDNMRENWELVPYSSKELDKKVMDFERFFVPVQDSVSGSIVSYDIIETSSEYGDEYDFDEIYSTIYNTGNITAVSLNSLRRIFSVIYEFQQKELNLPVFIVTTMFNGNDCDVVIKTLQEILNYYPIDCSKICINLTQDMLASMDMRRVAELTDFLRGCGFEMGVYNVGLNSINTKVFTKHLFNRVTFSSSFIDDITDGLIPVEILVYLIECFTGLGTYTYLPLDTDDEVVKVILKHTDLPFGVHSHEFVDLNDFLQSVKSGEEIEINDLAAIEAASGTSLVMSDKMYDEILEQTKSFIFEWIPRIDTVKFSGSFEKIYGYTPTGFEFIKNIRASSLLHSDDIKKFLEKINSARSETSDTECLVRIYNANTDSYVWNRVHFVSIRNAAGIPTKIMAVCADVSEERLTLNDDEQRKDRTDFITNLYNRTAAENKIRSYLYDEGVSGNHALMVVDMVGFEEMEKEFGKPFANAVLRESAGSIRELFRDSDVIGRINGSQFIVFVKGLGRREVLAEKGEAIVASLSRTCQTDKGERTINAKVGISLYPEDGQSYEELYESALKALYYSKHSVVSDTTFAIDGGSPRLMPAE